MVSRQYLCPATGGVGGVVRLRGELDLLSLGEALVGGRGERIGLAGVEVDVGAGGIGGETGATRAAVGETLSPGRIPGATADSSVSSRDEWTLR